MSNETENEELKGTEEAPANESEATESDAVEGASEATADAENQSDDSGEETQSDSDDGDSEDEGLNPEEVTIEQVKELIEQAGKAQQFQEKWIRLTADFENYKKRALRDKTEALKYANEALIEKLLPVMDNFEAALVAMNNDSAGSMDSLKMGVNMISKQLRDTLGDFGLREVDALGQQFDHHIHEAVSQKVTEDEPEGQVVEQLRKGYKLKDRLVRAASVVVAKAPGGEEESDDAAGDTSEETAAATAEGGADKSE